MFERLDKRFFSNIVIHVIEINICDNSSIGIVFQKSPVAFIRFCNKIISIAMSGIRS